MRIFPMAAAEHAEALRRLAARLREGGDYYGAGACTSAADFIDDTVAGLATPAAPAPTPAPEGGG